MKLKFLKACARYLLSYENLGINSTIKNFWYNFFQSLHAKKLILQTKKFRKIYWNLKIYSLITHFFTNQAEIYSPVYKINIQTIIDLGANIVI